MISELPRDPKLRRVIIVLSAADYEWSVYGGDEKVKIPKGTIPVPVGDYIDIHDPLLAKLEDQGLLTPGNVLVQSPFSPQTYVLEDEAVVSFHLVKLSMVSELCQILGATSVKSRTETFRMDRSKRSGTVEVARSILHGEMTLQYVTSDEAKMHLELSDSFDGGAPDIPRANEFLTEHGLRDMKDLVTLVSMRARSNPVRHRDITVSYGRVGDRSLELSMKVEVPFAKIGTEYRSQKEYAESFSQLVEVQFGS